MQQEALKEHAWLRQLVGEWTYEGECVMGPDQPPTSVAGQETVRALGDLWVLCEMTSPMPDGGIAHNVMTLGFDPQKGRFVGSFISSAMTLLWIYEGTLDESGTVLTLEADGPSFSGEGTLTYQDIVEIRPNGERRLSSRVPGPDGEWLTFMTTRYNRTA